MKALIISMKNQIYKRISGKGWLWIALLYLGSIFFYLEFFDLLVSIGLALFITLVLVSMLMVGYLRLGASLKFSIKEFVLFVILFSSLRFAYIYFFLSNHLPDYTLFHYPGRALPITILTSASLLFLGYSYAIYEWGLAARDKYAEKLSKNDKKFEQPIALRCSGKSVYMMSEDIIYLNANGEYVDYNTLSKKYTCFKRLKVAEAELNPFGFLRTHRSYIINPIFVESIGITEILMKGDVTIPLSKKYKTAVQEAVENRWLD